MAEHCRSCGARIQWVTTSSGRQMPLDYYPDDDGNVVVRFTGRGPRAEVVRSSRRRELALAGTPLYQSHFVTCPFADEHRRRA